jgi:aspartate aminotransferase
MSDIQLAERMSRLGTETAFVVLAKAKQLEAQGKSVIHLEIGEPDFDTPANIVEAAVKALHDGYTHYGPAPGLPEFRETIAEHVGALRGVEFHPDQVVVTPGAKPIMFFCIQALVNEGEEVIYPNPGFPIYESVIDYIGAKSVPIRISEETGFRMDIDELASLITPKTKMIIINSPQNPCGGVLSADDLAAVARLAAKHDIWVLSDEIYSRILYDRKHDSISVHEEIHDKLIILDGFSKTYAMTGWRLGYGVMPAQLAPWIARLQTNANSCTASFTQVAGIEALRGPQGEVDKMVAEFDRRRKVIVEGLNKIEGLTCLNPEGAFYVFPNITKLGLTEREMEDRLLSEAGVACLAGTSFGAFGEGYVRFSYANSVENIEEALSRIESFVGKL